MCDIEGVFVGARKSKVSVSEPQRERRNAYAYCG